MPIGQCLREHTFKQYRICLAWMDMEWNRPSRSDNYLMQVAAEVRRGYAKDPKKVATKDLQLEFKSVTVGKATSQWTKEQATAFSKARWFAAVGLKLDPKSGNKKSPGRRRRVPKTEAAEEPDESRTMHS